MRLARGFIRLGYVPAMLLGLNAAAIALVARGHSYAWIGFLFIVAVLFSLLAERVLPYEQAWNSAHDDVGKDAAHGIVYELNNIIALLLLPVITLFIPWRSIWPASLPIAVQLLLAIAIADFSLTMIHYLSHRVGWMWKLHAVHHGVYRLYGFNGLVRHPLHQALDLGIGTLPLVLAGLPMDVAVLLAFAISVQLLVQHSNVDFTVGRARDFLAVGDVHRLHHVHWQGEGDVNFGLFSTLWDRLLGTYKNESPRAPVAGDIGAQDFPHFPQNYVEQVLLPFRHDEAVAAYVAESRAGNARS
jgi:sterol desaturase/sphingolipid hydroxylase (fatty acid hydroxylase superfamily)